MRLIRSCVIAITMIGAVALAQVTPGTEGRPIQGRSPAPPPPGPLVDLVKAGVDAYNKGDISYFDKIFADDMLWVDEDGHEMTTKMFALFLLNRQLTATPKRTMSVHDIATGTWGDTACLQVCDLQPPIRARRPSKSATVCSRGLRLNVEPLCGCPVALV